ncbi:MAG: hypothetical protein NC033_01570 [Clostridiales bacterium]|nr:hypothetical protein [Clostridiales bacterium]
MIKFDDGETVRLLRKKKLGLNACYVIFALLLVSAVLAAVLARGVYSDGAFRSNHLYALAFAAVCLVALVGVIAFVTAPTERALKLAVNSKIAKELLSREDFFAGDGRILFAADYSGDVLTLTRQNYTGAINLDPFNQKSTENIAAAGTKIEFGLKELKAVPSLYATIGTRLWLFLQAYYFLHGAKNGVESVYIADNMGKKPVFLQVFAINAPLEKAKKNYFIKKGLIK